MSGKAVSRLTSVSEEAGQAPLPSISAIAVGDLNEWRQTGRICPNERLLFLSFSEITSDLLSDLQPEAVFSPLLARDFDCIDLAMRLHQFGFAGSYRAVASGLPIPEMVESEVKQLCPHLDFQIVHDV